jgi:hypothetical protein
MANTLKFGNGEWYGKKDTILAYNDENNNYKPLPFDFSRGSSATIVNKDGLIETVGSGEPRIDYKDNTKGALLLEPSRSNKITYSEDFSELSTGGNMTIESGFLAPDGTLNARKITCTDNTGLISVGGTLANDARTIYARTVSGTGTAQLLSHNTNTNNIFTITEQWQRFELNSTPSVASNFYVIDFRDPSQTLTEVILWGAQAEVGSYATSYIPTSGGAVTRLREEANNQSNLMSGLTDMAMFLDYELPNGNSSGYRNQLGFRDNNNANFYMIQFPNSNTHEFRYTGVANVNVDMTPSMSEQDFGLRRKLLYTKTGTTLKVFCNGIQVSTVTSASATTFSTTSEILNVGENYDAEMKIKDWKLYNNGFTDAEAITLTTI